MTDRTEVKEDFESLVAGFADDEDDLVSVSDIFGILDTQDAEGSEGSSVGTEEGAGAEEEQGKASEAPAPQDGGSTDDDGQQAEPKAKPADAPPAVQEPPQQPTVDPRDAEMARLRAQIEALTAQREQAPVAPDAPSAKEEKKPNGPQVIPVSLPQQLYEAIMNVDEPAQSKQALDATLTHLVSGLSARFEARLAQVEEQISGRFSALSEEQTAQTQRATAEQQRSEYFKEFPQHNNAIVMPLLQSEMATMLAETPDAPWDQNFRAALGARVTKQLEDAGYGPAQRQPAQQPPVSLPTQAPRPAQDSVGGFNPEDVFK